MNAVTEAVDGLMQMGFVVCSLSFSELDYSHVQKSEFSKYVMNTNKD